jgi:hypothetical protein
MDLLRERAATVAWAIRTLITRDGVHLRSLKKALTSPPP